MSTVVIIGFRGVGKSSLGKALAENWKCELIDSDKILESVIGTSLEKYANDCGEESFREKESATVAALLHALDFSKQQVVVLGGGALESKTTFASLCSLKTKETVTFVWLTASIETVQKRLQQSETRVGPLKSITALNQLYKKREASYQKLADIELATEQLTIDQVLASLLRLLSHK